MPTKKRRAKKPTPSRNLMSKPWARNALAEVDRARIKRQKPPAIEPPQHETVNHPAHYNAHPSGVEAIDVIEHMTFNVGNSVKYCWRAGLKPTATRLEDLKKGRWYLDREIARLEKEARKAKRRTKAKAK